MPFATSADLPAIGLKCAKHVHAEAQWVLVLSSHRKIAIEVVRRCERDGLPPKGVHRGLQSGRPHGVLWSAKKEEKREAFSRHRQEHAIDGLLWSAKKDERERRFQEVCAGDAGTYVFSVVL